MKFRINYILFRQFNNLLLIALIGFIFVLLIKYNNYSINKKHEEFSRIINNIYLKKTTDLIISKIKSNYENISHKVSSGEKLNDILKKYKISNNETVRVIYELKKYTNPNKLKPGDEIKFIIKQDQNKSLEILEYPVSKTIKIIINRDYENKLKSRKIVTKLFKKNILAEGFIENSLYKSALKQNVHPNIIVEFARIYGFEIDFQRDIRKNDSYQILYENFVDEHGGFYNTGKKIFARMYVQNREISLYRFDNNNNEEGYFDISGKSVEKALMKTPINGASLSSSFGMRKHPILGYNKMHRGTDFAAPEGTPIMASGTGKIVRAKWCGGGGNCIKIKHNSTYSTVYAHLKSFAKNIRLGKKVKQGSIIGYVGSTGMSTGPHLHYEVHINGKKVNSQKLKLPSGKTLKGKERKLFEIERIKTDVLLADIISNKN